MFPVIGITLIKFRFIRNYYPASVNFICLHTFIVIYGHCQSQLGLFMAKDARIAICSSPFSLLSATLFPLSSRKDAELLFVSFAACYLFHANSMLKSLNLHLYCILLLAYAALNFVALYHITLPFGIPSLFLYFVPVFSPVSLSLFLIDLIGFLFSQFYQEVLL